MEFLLYISSTKIAGRRFFHKLPLVAIKKNEKTTNNVVNFSTIWSNQSIEISNETLETEDNDIERIPQQLSYKEIENLHIEFRYFKNLPGGKSIFPISKIVF